jgi:hypothetical protein
VNEEKKQAPTAAATTPASAKTVASPQKPKESTPPKPLTATATQQDQEPKAYLDWKRTLKDFDLKQEATIDGKKIFC